MKNKNKLIDEIIKDLTPVALDGDAGTDEIDTAEIDAIEDRIMKQLDSKIDERLKEFNTPATPSTPAPAGTDQETPTDESEDE